MHFSRFAPEKIPYAINRYAREAERHWGILDDQLGKHRYMLGDAYTLVDMAVWGWSTRAQFVLGDEAFAKLTHVKRHLDEISARPAAQRAVALKDRFTFKTEVDEEARRILFPQNAHLRPEPSPAPSDAVHRKRQVAMTKSKRPWLPPPPGPSCISKARSKRPSRALPASPGK